MEAYNHFTLAERESLALQLSKGCSYSSIAKQLGRHRSSIGREIKRNQSQKSEYMPLSATTKYLRRRKKSKRKLRYQTDQALITFTKEGLAKAWPPETIVALWKQNHVGVKLSHSTIYRALEKKLLDGYSGFTHLRRRNKQKYVRKNSAVIKPDFTIHDRPPVVETRNRIGDWEGDTLMGGPGKGAVVVMTDRKSRYYLARLVDNLKSELIETTVYEMLVDKTVETITLDNGKEFAKHRNIAKSLNTKIYFADPKSPWQRGTNENLNDVLRFFYPKGCDFRAVTQAQLDATLELINTRPRKCLGWLSPKDVFLAKCCT
jgi:IS30 family transposase